MTTSDWTNGNSCIEYMVRMKKVEREKKNFYYVQEMMVLHAQ